MLSREMTARDRRFVVPTWARSARYDGMRMPERFKLVDRILASDVRVLVLASDDITVHAWACGGHDVLHFAYCPPELRGCGFARDAITRLFGHYPDRIDCSHKWPRESTRFRYRPHLLFREAA
jgi:hypothetical protein